MAELQFVGMVFESFIIVIALILLVLILIKYYEKKHQLTLYLFVIFMFYIIAIIFSWFSKILVLYSGIDYVSITELQDPGTPLSWILLRITGFRLSFVFLTVAIYLSYVLKVNVFERNYNRIGRVVVVLYSLFIIGFSLTLYQKGNILLDVLAFLFVFIFMTMIYLPFFIRSFQSYKSARNRIIKKAFLSLALMSLFFILVPFNFLIDRLTILLGGAGYSIFYFLAWIFVIFGIIGACFGYIRPKIS